MREVWRILLSGAERVRSPIATEKLQPNFPQRATQTEGVACAREVAPVA